MHFIQQRSAPASPGGEATAAATTASWRCGAREALVQGEDEDVRPGVGRGQHAQGQAKDIESPARHRCGALEEEPLLSAMYIHTRTDKAYTSIFWGQVATLALHRTRTPIDRVIYIVMK